VRGKCRVFRRKRFTFPRGSQGHRHHRPLSRHLQSLPPGESAGFSCENGSLSPVAGRGTGSTDPSGRTCSLSPRGKCREFLRKRFTFPRGRPGHRHHRPLSPHLPSLPPGKVPGISTKTVHFPPWLAGAPAPQASLAALAVSPSRGKCRVFLRKRFTFPRDRQGYRLHRPLSPHLAFLLPGKVPGFSAKTVHFPPRLVGVPAPQASLAALGISTPGESAGNFGENGSLSPAAGRCTGSTDPSGRTCRFHLRGKCRDFPRKRFTFPHGRPGYRHHRPLSLHLQSLPPGKVPGFSAKTVHFPPRHETSGEVQQGLHWEVLSIQAL